MLSFDILGTADWIWCKILEMAGLAQVILMHSDSSQYSN